jgi:predicted kinase
MAKVVPSKPMLVMFYGFPGSGKSFFARQLGEQLQAAHVHGDRIRNELFEQPRFDKEENAVVGQLMDYMTNEFLNAGISVLYDTNAMRQSQRLSLRESARRSHAKPILIWLQIDTESAIARATSRDRRTTDDKYSAPIDQRQFDDIASHMQNPTSAEDYIVISGKHSFPTQSSAVFKRLRELGLLGAEASSRVIKPGLVNLVPNPMAGRVDMSRRNIVIR